MRIKQRKHTTSGVDGYSEDYYPDIDGFIPEAERIANLKYPDSTIKDYNNKWSQCFLGSMDKILVKHGLRVL